MYIAPYQLKRNIRYLFPLTLVSIRPVLHSVSSDCKSRGKVRVKQCSVVHSRCHAEPVIQTSWILCSFKWMRGKRKSGDLCFLLNLIKKSTFDFLLVWNTLSWSYWEWIIAKRRFIIEFHWTFCIRLMESYF